MKKLIILGLIATVTLADYERTVFERMEKKKEYKSDYITFTGVVFNIREYREYNEITISTKEHGRIRIKSTSKYFMEGQKVSGTCGKLEYGFYNSCSLY